MVSNVRVRKPGLQCLEERDSEVEGEAENGRKEPRAGASLGRGRQAPGVVIMPKRATRAKERLIAPPPSLSSSTISSPPSSPRSS